VHVDDVRAPPAQGAADAEQRGQRRGGSHPARHDEHPDAVAAEAVVHLVALVLEASELERVRPAKYRYVMAGVYQRSRLLRSVFEEEVADDQDAHGARKVPQGCCDALVAATSGSLRP
jgi:hypothetical protein